MSMTLFVGNLSFKASELDLQGHFERYGSIRSVKIPTDKETGKKRGFGFVEFADHANAERAMQELNDQEFMERRLTINEARPMEKRSQGGGGGQRRDYDSRR
jgi:RNA recognition motif-containing protein